MSNNVNTDILERAAEMADEGLSTDLLKKAIEDLQNTIYVRENVPF